jgi:hypothetical protein
MLSKFFSRISPGPWICAFLGCMVPVILIFSPLFWGQILFHRDLSHWNFPVRAFFRDSVLRGDWPTWVPIQALGFPVMADPLYGLFYLPNWLYLLVGSGWVATLLTGQALAHVLWGGLGIFLMARRLGGSPTVVSVSAVAWMLSGLVAAHASTGIILFADAWIPWHGVGMLALFDGLQHRRWMAGVVKAALPIAFSLLLGEMFFALFGLAFGLCIFGSVFVMQGRSELSRRRVVWRGLGTVAFTWALGMSLGAIVLVPMQASLIDSERGHTLSRERAEVSSFHPIRVLELVLPGSMGDADGAYPSFHVIGDRGLDGGPLTYGTYLGITVFALALVGLNRRRPLSLVLGALAFAALLIAMGKYLPFHGAIRRLIFPLAYQRYPEKYLILTFTFLALLAGMGVARWTEGGGRKRLWVLFGGIVVFAMVTPWCFPPDWRPFVLRGAVKAGILLLVLLGILVLFRQQRRLGAVLLVLLVSLDLFSAQLPSHVWLPQVVAATPPRSAEVLKKDFEQSNVHTIPRLYFAQRALTSVSEAGFRIPRRELEMRFTQTLLPNYSNVFGIASIPGYDVGISPLFNLFWSKHLGFGPPVLRLLSVDYALLPSPEPGKPERSGLLPIWEPVVGSRLYRVQNSLPRVYLTGAAVPMSDSQAMEKLVRPAVVLGEKAVVPEGALHGGLDQPGRTGTCHILLYQNRRIQATCQANRESLAVFVEQYAPGWTATVDGNPTPIVRANLFMRGIRVGTGQHVLEMVYSPPGFQLGFVVSLFGILTLLLLTFLNRRQKTKNLSAIDGTLLEARHPNQHLGP